MARKDRVEAYFKRRELIKLLGGVCVDCGTKGSKKNPLEIDHVEGREYEVREMDSVARVIQYWKEFYEGVKLEVRCKRHNANAHKTALGKAVVVSNEF